MFGTLKLSALLLVAHVLVTHAGPVHLSEDDKDLFKRNNATSIGPTCATFVTTILTTSLPVTTVATTITNTTTVTNTITVTTTPTGQSNVCGGATAFCCNSDNGGKVDCIAINGATCTGTVVCCNANSSLQICIGNVVGDKNHINIHQKC